MTERKAINIDPNTGIITLHGNDLDPVYDYINPAGCSRCKLQIGTYGEFPETVSYENGVMILNCQRLANGDQRNANCWIKFGSREV